MIAWAILGAGGVPLRMGSGPTLPEGAVALSAGVAPRDLVARFHDGKDWQPRPALPDPGIATSAEAVTLLWSGLPDGAAAEVVGLDGASDRHAAEGGALFLTLAGPGPHVIDMRAPAPWMPQSLTVEHPEAAVARAEATALAARRAAMIVSRLQGRLTLGPQVCARLDAIAADPDTPWAMREAIASAIEWRRDSQTITELGWLLGFSDDLMDRLFEAAARVKL